MTTAPVAVPPVVVIAGPTASGKSALALALAARFDGMVVNADSMQVYRELRVLTARPDPCETARVPHRLFAVLGAAERCSAGRWLALAEGALAEAAAARRPAFVVGGTGLYLRALSRGLSPIPPIPPGIRDATRQLLDEIGAAALHARLAARDAQAGARIRPTDRQRVARAWEVLAATGRSITDWQRQPPEPHRRRLATLHLLPPRETLYGACDARFERMLAAGALDEAQLMAGLGLDPDLPAMKAVGLVPLLRHLEGALSFDEARRIAQRDTRRYAKRQMTWLRHQMTADRRWDAQYSERLNDESFSFISKFLLTPSP
jgi:tRNA dimethylallyltransferase